jgi:hypothetical protein
MDSFDKQKISLKKHIIRSKTDLEIPSSYLLYVEKEYHTEINQLLTKEYNNISKEISRYDNNGKLIHLPGSFFDLFDKQEDIRTLFNYYYPNAKIGDDFQDKISNAINTHTFTDLVFSLLTYNEKITPGFLRFVRKEPDYEGGNYLYEYIRLDVNSPVSIKKQVIICLEHSYNNKHESLFSDTPKSLISKITEKFLRYSETLFEDEPEESQAPAPTETHKQDDKKSQKTSGDLFKSFFNDKEEDDDDSDHKSIFQNLPKSSSHKTFPKFPDKKSIFEKKDTQESPSTDIPEFLRKKKTDPDKELLKRKIQTNKFYREISAIPEKEFKEPEPEKPAYIAEEPDLISRIKSDIMEAKKQGLLDILIKEVGVIFFEDKNQIYQPSRLVINQDFKIYLPDFDHMEIEMTPLPKSLFILFLRHPEGIFLKHIADYKQELLEIYKLLSYKEKFSDIVDSINRICNPTDGSINEKLSRIKEAFIKKIAIEYARNYIITGERGQTKKIMLNRSLLQLPAMFEEVILKQ